MEVFDQNLAVLHVRGLLDADALAYFRQPAVAPARLLALADAAGVGLDRLLRRPLVPATDLRLLVLDVDGVMTDGGMYYTERGDEIKKFNTKDGLAIGRLTKAGVPVGFLSSGYTREIIPARARTLGVQWVHVGREPKLDILQDWCGKLGITLAQVAYVGDDLNDEAVMRRVGLAACPADAAPAICALADVVLSRRGGEGCVRELIDQVWPHGATGQ